MNRRIGTIAILAGLWAGCKSASEKFMEMPQDPHSYSRPVDARVTHLHWKAHLDFETRTIRATAIWDIEQLSDANVIILDTKDLTIDSVTVDGKATTAFELGKRDEVLGTPLSIPIGPDSKRIAITYETSPAAEALQWLEPSQTAGKQHPFLFTQSQAILARSWVPCQDSPGIRFTYDAEVTGPDALLILMSAENPTQKNEQGVYAFKMDQPIPSYLLALAAGDLRFEAISPRAGIYAEPSMVEKAAWEFADLEKMIAAAEQLYGPYQWGRYDVLVLPPSFPFGGMENPRLTFATPTILSGDRSLTSLIAHELAHSWSGNLVTNATWNDFWLNEGFTVYFEHRIMEALYGSDYAEMLAGLALQDLQETIADLKQQGLPQDTKLKLSLDGRNPDDGVTDIAYNKGYFFLRKIEEDYGRDKFDQFLTAYFSGKAFSSVNTDDFMAFIKGFYRERYKITIPDSDFTAWIFTEGLPDQHPVPSTARFAVVEEVIKSWQETPAQPFPVTDSWTTHEWLHFLKNVPQQLSIGQMRSLDELGDLTASDNAEILTQWLVLVVRNQYVPAYGKLEAFLIATGRRKFLVPVYAELAKTPEGLEMARGIYAKARPNYHFVATNTFDKMLK